MIPDKRTSRIVELSMPLENIPKRLKLDLYILSPKSLIFPTPLQLPTFLRSIHKDTVLKACGFSDGHAFHKNLDPRLSLFCSRIAATTMELVINAPWLSGRELEAIPIVGLGRNRRNLREDER